MLLNLLVIVGGTVSLSTCLLMMFLVLFIDTLKERTYDICMFILIFIFISGFMAMWVSLLLKYLGD